MDYKTKPHTNGTFKIMKGKTTKIFLEVFNGKTQCSYTLPLKVNFNYWTLDTKEKNYTRQVYRNDSIEWQSNFYDNFYIVINHRKLTLTQLKQWGFLFLVIDIDGKIYKISSFYMPTFLNKKSGSLI